MPAGRPPSSADRPPDEWTDRHIIPDNAPLYPTMSYGSKLRPLVSTAEIRINSPEGFKKATTTPVPLSFRPEDGPPKKEVALRAFQILRFRAEDFVARGANPLIQRHHPEGFNNLIYDAGLWAIFVLSLRS